MRWASDVDAARSPIPASAVRASAVVPDSPAIVGGTQAFSTSSNGMLVALTTAAVPSTE